MICYIGALSDTADDAWQGITPSRKQDFITDWRKLWRTSKETFDATNKPKITKSLKHLYNVLNELIKYKPIHTDCPTEGM